MQDIYQKTVTEPIVFSGIGLHSGKTSKIKILPAKPDEGIVFKRSDLNQNNKIEANYKNVSSAKLCTTLENRYGVKISTVEHLLAAFYIAGVDNALVEVNCEEVPIMDGSAKDYLAALKKNKLISLTKKRKYLQIKDAVELKDGKRMISIKPFHGSFEVDFQLNYQNKLISNQKNKVNFQMDKLKDVINSRTFCLFKDIEKIKKIGLAKGGSLDNAVVVDENKVLNKGGLRNEKEFVNHKILDLAGDFSLSGYRILGKVKCYQGGHKLSNMFLRKLLKSKSSYTTIELNNIDSSERSKVNQAIKLAVNA